MDYRIDPPKRKVIPNWRYFNNTANLGELKSYENLDLINEDLYPIDEYINDWMDSKSIYRASDLISAAISNSQKNNPYVIDAAKFLLTVPNKTNPIQRQAAQFIIDATEENECNKSIVRLQNDAIEKLKTASDIHKTIHSLRILAHAYPYNPITYVDMARAYVIIGQKKKAEKLIRMALYLDPKNRFTARAAARFYIHIGDNERAADIIKQTGFSRYDPWLMASDISIAMMLGKRSGNIKRGEQMVFSNKYTAFSISELSSALGTVEIEDGTRKKSRELFNRSLIDPNDNSLAQAEWVIIASQLPITIHPYTTVKYNHESLVYKALENNDIKSSIYSAIDWICDMPFSLKPIMIGYDISTTFLRDYNLSSKILDVGLKSHPNDPWMLNNRAYVNARANNVIEAEKDMEKLERYNGTLTDSMTVCKEATKGLIAYRNKDKKTGERLYQHAINLADKLKANSKEVKLKAKINMLREELIYSNYLNFSVLEELEHLHIPENNSSLILLKEEILEEMEKHNHSIKLQ